MNKRELTQITAALLFWAAVDRSSRTKPAGHPAVIDLFSPDHPPLTAEEIVALVAEVQGLTSDRFYTVSEIAEQLGAPVAHLRSFIKWRGYKPIREGMKPWLFRESDVGRMVREYTDGTIRCNQPSSTP